MFKRILIVVDPRAVSRAAVGVGAALAHTHGAEVVLFYVLPRFSVPVADMPPFLPTSPQEFQQAAQAAADKALKAACALCDRAGVVSKSVTGSGEDDARVIVEAARKRRCDFIVVASEGRIALLRLLTGSVIPGVITASPVPVLVCKAPARAKVGAEVAVMPLKARRARRAAGSSMH
jgi:nucleotide-binding universal stress UspA family protein